MTRQADIDYTALLARIVAGRAVDVRAEVAPIDPDALLDAAAGHDVVPLVAEHLLSRPELPPVLADRLREQAHAAAVVDLVREAEIRRCLEACDRNGVGVLLVKGGHLAYTHYPRPDLRSRIDTDLLIAPSSMDVLHRLLTRELEYEASDRVSNDLTAPQRSYFRRTPRGSHAFDVHWQLTSPRAFAAMPSYEMLAAEARPIPQFGPVPRVPSPVHALLIACVHRVAHHLGAPDLKWLFDIHLIAGRLDEREWDRFVTLARQHQVGRVCRSSLEAAAQAFGTPLPDWMTSGDVLQSELGDEASAAYLADRSMLHRVAADARALPWRGRIHLALAHLFPPESYMRRVYAPGSRAPLAVLYLRRVLRGLGGWLRRPPVARDARSDTTE